jgi:hypothetical protein
VAGGAVGVSIKDKQEQGRRQERAAHEEAVKMLFQRLEKVSAEFGWTTRILRDAVG